jgi:hypothetical protein
MPTPTLRAMLSAIERLQGSMPSAIGGFQRLPMKEIQGFPTPAISHHLTIANAVLHAKHLSIMEK